MPVVVHPGRTLEVEASISTDPIELEPIQVAVRSSYLERNGYYLRERNSMGRFFDRAELDEIFATSLTDVLQRVPGIAIRQADKDFLTVAQSRRSISWGLGAEPGIFTDAAARPSSVGAGSVDSLSREAKLVTTLPPAQMCCRLSAEHILRLSVDAACLETADVRRREKRIGDSEHAAA